MMMKTDANDDSAAPNIITEIIEGASKRLWFSKFFVINNDVGPMVGEKLEVTKLSLLKLSC